MRSKVVYILGAGFSAPLGLPVMSNFLSRSKDLYAENAEEFNHFDTVFKEIFRMSQAKNYLNIDLFNIEEILSILEMEDYAAGTKHQAAFTKYLAETIIALTPNFTPNKETPRNWQDFVFAKEGLIRKYCQWVAGLFQSSIVLVSENGRLLTPNHPNNYSDDFGIISLNYDMVLECCLKTVNGVTTPEGGLCFRSTIEGNGLALAKIHGSVDPLTIVPPTWQKTGSKEVRAAWELAVHLLKQANEIRILGYSFPQTDGYVRYLLSLGAMRATHLKHIDVVCRDSSGRVEERYSQFMSFPGFRFSHGDIGQYISSYGDRTDEKDPSTHKGNEAVRFKGINEHHHRLMAAGSVRRK